VRQPLASTLFVLSVDSHGLVKIDIITLMKYKVPFLARFLVGNQNRDPKGADKARDFLQRFSRKN
jgi:hypothetical protein